MSRYKMSRKTARARKSMKMGADDLQEMVKAAVKEALDEQKAEDGSEDDPEESGGDLGEILDAAIEAVNAKRKSAKSDELNPDDTEELVGAILEEAGAAEDGKSDDEATDLEEVIKAACEAVNEKRKSAKADEIGDDVVDEILDAVAEVMSDDAADEEGKGRKEAYSRQRQTKSYGSRGKQRKAVKRKYSDIFLKGGNGGGMQKKKEEVPPLITFARAVKCLDVYGRQDPERAAYYARKKYDDTEMEREFKALSATNPTDGGYLIPEVYSDQIIELLYPKTVIVELGAQTVPLTNGNLNLPKMTAGARAQWGGEQRKIKTSQTKFGNIKLSAKRLEAIIPQSRELLMLSTFSSDSMFANDLTRRMQLGLDYGGLYGAGAEFQPFGIANNKEVENIDATKIGNDDLADTNGKITPDLPIYVRSKAMSKNIDDIHAGWAMNSMLEGIFLNMKTQMGTYIYREEMATGKLCGFPYKVSNQIPTDNGKTDLFFGNWSDLLIGDQMGLETYTTLDGTWTDEDGVQHNAFEENLAATRALMYDDIGVRHAESFIYCKNIKVM